MGCELEDLKTKRKAIGISLRKVATFVGCSYETIRLIENGALKNSPYEAAYKKCIAGLWSGEISYEKAKNCWQFSTVSKEEAQHLKTVREVLKISRPVAAPIIRVSTNVLRFKEIGRQYMTNAEHDTLYAFYLAEYQKIKRCFDFYFEEATHDAD